MNKIKKALAKLDQKDKMRVKKIVQRLERNKTTGLNIKRLRGTRNVFRVRQGRIRIIYRFDDEGNLFLLKIATRKEDTYKL